MSQLVRPGPDRPCQIRATRCQPVIRVGIVALRCDREEADVHTGGPTGEANAGTPHREGTTRHRQWWGVAALAVAISITAVVVPPLVTSWSDNTATPPGATASRSASPTAGSTGASESPASPAPGATHSTPAGSPLPTLSHPAAQATTGTPFTPIRVTAADPSNVFYESNVVACGTCASGSRVQYLGQGHYVVLNIRNVPVAGPRTLTITYECNTPRTLLVGVNDTLPVSLLLEGAGDWFTPAQATMPITLSAGDSQIKFFNNAAPAPDLDQILIS